MAPKQKIQTAEAEPVLPIWETKTFWAGVVLGVGELVAILGGLFESPKLTAVSPHIINIAWAAAIVFLRQSISKTELLIEGGK